MTTAKLTIELIKPLNDLIHNHLIFLLVIACSVNCNLAFKSIIIWAFSPRLRCNSVSSSCCISSFCSRADIFSDINKSPPRLPRITCDSSWTFCARNSSELSYSLLSRTLWRGTVHYHVDDKIQWMLVSTHSNWSDSESRPSPWHFCSQVADVSLTSSPWSGAVCAKLNETLRVRGDRRRRRRPLRPPAAGARRSETIHDRHRAWCDDEREVLEIATDLFLDSKRSFSSHRCSGNVSPSTRTTVVISAFHPWCTQTLRETSLFRRRDRRILRTGLTYAENNNNIYRDSISKTKRDKSRPAPRVAGATERVRDARHPRGRAVHEGRPPARRVVGPCCAYLSLCDRPHHGDSDTRDVINKRAVKQSALNYHNLYCLFTYYCYRAITEAHPPTMTPVPI